jgi:hypothetical protein
MCSTRHIRLSKDADVDISDCWVGKTVVFRRDALGPLGVCAKVMSEVYLVSRASTNVRIVHRRGQHGCDSDRKTGEILAVDSCCEVRGSLQDNPVQSYCCHSDLRGSVATGVPVEGLV